MKAFFAAFSVALLLPATVVADPCGMVPPVSVPDHVTGPPIVREGIQRTYVAFRNGMETMVLRPEFRGHVEDFGMLIPFPSVPGLRKVDDATFAHIEGAIDPPTVQVRVYDNRPLPRGGGIGAGAFGRSDRAASAPSGLALARDEVVVLKEEAVGMYEVAVLAAGGSDALETWMTTHKYRYPTGMDAVVEDYVDERWVFVAVKTRVGRASGAHAEPGMRTADTSFPSGASFDGAVQGMGFRFRVDAPVVPMRLSVFNGRDPRNVVYMLTDRPMRIDGVPEQLVVRQVGGSELAANITAPLPVRYTPAGADARLGPTGRERVAAARSADPINGVARELFAADMSAMSGGRLSLPFEEEEKELLRISEALGLRGPAIDRLHASSIDEQRERTLDGALDGLGEMTMTVVEGVLPGDLLETRNLTFSEYHLPAAQNARRESSIRLAAPSLVLYEGQ